MKMANDPAVVAAMAADPEARGLRQRLLELYGKYRYSYNFSWWGRPIIQLPDDVMALQMLVMAQRPDLIVETGVAHGGSLVFYASLLSLYGEGRVIGVDIDIRAPNRAAIEAHPLAGRIRLIQGSSVDPAVALQVAEAARGAARTFVCLDSNHTAEHVGRELDLYSPLVGPGGYLVVFDTALEDVPAPADRPWGPGNGPRTAVRAFLARNRRFVVDDQVDQLLFVSASPGGYLRCIE